MGERIGGCHMGKITDAAFQAYKGFIERHCNTKILCKDCPKWKGKCTHPNHPMFKLFSK
jgi:hypothetical protein